MRLIVYLSLRTEPSLWATRFKYSPARTIRSILSNEKYKPGYHCTTPHVTKQQIKEAFVHALTERVSNDAVLDGAMQLLDDTVYNATELEARQTEITARMEKTVALMNQLITENATSARDPDEYDESWHQLEQRYQQQEQEHQKLCDQIADPPPAAHTP